MGVLTDADYPSGRTITLRSQVNNLYVAMEQDYAGNHNGMLRARSSSTSGWESFTLKWISDQNGWALISNMNGRYVSAEIEDGDGDTGMLRARSTTASGWEIFELHRFEPGVYGFRLKATGLYVAAEINYGSKHGLNHYGMLRARTQPGDLKRWERFVLP